MLALRCEHARHPGKPQVDASGLSGITLVGVEVQRCTNCGELEVTIPRIKEIHRLIALTLLRKPARLTPAEIRFLRKYLGWSGKDFAAHVGVAPETVSRWEQGQDQMGVSADRLLRLMVVHEQPKSDYSLDALGNVATSKPRPIRMDVELSRKDGGRRPRIPMPC